MSQSRKRNFDRTDELPTAADYIAAGAAPLLIMVMVGALVWFAQDLIYQGAHALRLRWTLFWFVIGMVGISRIAIERTPTYAGLFALGLGGAVAIMINQFFVMPLAGWLLLGAIWWCTNKLVWDCTLIDEQEDASGEGLLEVAGMDETSPNEAREDVAVKSIGTGPNRKAVKLPWWKRLFVNRSERTGQPHAAGLWIIYFSLAALPLFGLGQAMLTRANRSSPGLILLAVYLAAATGLLLLTSFLGLRRYLRQRRLKMPAAIAGTWIGAGALVVAAVLTLSLALPRPITIASSQVAGTALTGKKLDEKSVLDDPNAQDESEKAKSGGEQTTTSAEQPNGTSQSPADAKPATEAQGSALPDRNESGAGNQASSPITLPAAPDWLRWIAWAALGLVLVYIAIRNWSQIVAAIRELIESLRAMFQPKSKNRPRSRNAGAAGPVLERKLRFAELENPFRAGSAVAPAVAVRQTYEALELWAAERGATRAPDITSTEFAQKLMSVHPELRDGIRRLARIYAGLLYADREPQPDELPPLAELWSAMESRPASGETR